MKPAPTPSPALIWEEYLSTPFSADPLRSLLAKVVYLDLLRRGGGPTNIRAIAETLHQSVGDIDAAAVDLTRVKLVVRAADQGMIQVAPGRDDDLLLLPSEMWPVRA